MRLRPDLQDLKRLRPLRVGVAYVLAGTAVLLLAKVAFAAFGAPPWAARLLAVTLLMGFPFVVAMSWALSAEPNEGARPRPWELDD